jgi:hypothetical protein
MRVVKSRRRDPLALDHGLFWVGDSDDYLVSADEGLTLDELELWLDASRPIVPANAPVCITCRRPL